MKKSSLYKAMAIVFSTAGLVACGGGGGGDSTTTTDTTASKIIGTLDGFGSVYVNGVKFETNSASYVVDDASASESDLAVGMKVKIEGTVNDDGVTGTADSIYYDDDIQGPIENFSPSTDGLTATFTVLGMAVLVEDKVTVFDDEDGSDSLSFLTLANGINIEVSGYFDGTQIVATRIEKQSDMDEFELKGTVASYINSEITLTLQNDVQAGPYDVTSTAESEIAEGSSGQFVEIKLNTSYEVTEIELDDDDLLDDNEDDVDLYGVLTGDYILGFMVNGVPLDLSGTIDYEPDTLENNLLDGMPVEVEGSMVDGILIVDEIEAESESEIEIEAQVTQVVAEDNANGTITLDLNGTDTLTVISDNSTLLEDDSDLDTDGDGSFTLTELTSADYIEVEAYQSGTDLIASKIKRKDSDSSSETTLEGPVEDFDSSFITLLGITYSFDAGTTFQVDENTPDTDSTVFFSGLVAGDIVEIKDDEPDGVADEVSRDTESSDD